MKNIIIDIIAILGVIILSSCGEKNKIQVENEHQLNISIYLDLSDRLIRDITPNQVYRDTAIINYIVDYFRSQTLGPTILKSRNKIKVFFYPTPNDSEISTLAQGLSVDIESKQGVEKRKALDMIKEIFQKNLAQIYGETLNENKWIGCDIWDFFSSKKVDNFWRRGKCPWIVPLPPDQNILVQRNSCRRKVVPLHHGKETFII